MSEVESDVPSADTETYIVRLLDECRQEIRLSDSKASIIFAAVATATALLANLLIDDTTALRNGGAGAVTFALLAVAALLSAMVLLGLAVMPRVGQPEPGRARWFEEQAMFATPTDLAAAVTRDSTASVERHAQQLLALSRTARRKFALLRRALLTIGTAMVVLVIAAVAVALH